MQVAELQLDPDRLSALCREHSVSKLELFGSFARGRANRQSDVDVLVTFDSDAKVGLGIVALQQSLQQLFGRPVDLLTRDAVERSANKYFRRFVLRSTEPLYERP